MIGMRYVWFFWTLAFLLPWGALFYAFPAHRQVMMRVSLWTMPFGLTEPLFFPVYWSPPTLFDLARRTGFDIESLVFCFAIGGVGSVLYNILTRKRLTSLDRETRGHPSHRFHYFALSSPAIVFLSLYWLDWSPIYPSILAMIFGSLATAWCRRDLAKNTWVGGLLFLAYYALFIGGLELLVPGYVAHVWNLRSLSGIVVIGIPLEELLFAFSFGTFWSAVYEHLTWQRGSLHATDRHSLRSSNSADM
jgi:hypothetical protein